MPNPGFREQVQQALPDKDHPIVIGCKSGERLLLQPSRTSAALSCGLLPGKRSATAWYVLHDLDFSSISNVAGGYDAWVSQGLPHEP